MIYSDNVQRWLQGLNTVYGISLDNLTIEPFVMNITEDGDYTILNDLLITSGYTFFGHIAFNVYKDPGTDMNWIGTNLVNSKINFCMKINSQNFINAGSYNKVIPAWFNNIGVENINAVLNSTNFYGYRVNIPNLV